MLEILISNSFSLQTKLNHFQGRTQISSTQENTQIFLVPYSPFKLYKSGSNSVFQLLCTMWTHTAYVACPMPHLQSCRNLCKKISCRVMQEQEGERLWQSFMNNKLSFQNNSPNRILLIASYPGGNKQPAVRKEIRDLAEKPLLYLFRDGYQWVMRDQKSLRDHLIQYKREIKIYSIIYTVFHCKIKLNLCVQRSVSAELHNQLQSYSVWQCEKGPNNSLYIIFTCSVTKLLCF